MQVNQVKNFAELFLNKVVIFGYLVRVITF